MLIGMPSARRSTKRIEGGDWEALYEQVRKPNETQKAKALWKMKAAKDRREEFCDPERKDNIFGKKQNATGTVGRAPQRVRVQNLRGNLQNTQGRGPSPSKSQVLRREDHPLGPPGPPVNNQRARELCTSVHVGPPAPRRPDKVILGGHCHSGTLPCRCQSAEASLPYHNVSWDMWPARRRSSCCPES